MKPVVCWFLFLPLSFPFCDIEIKCFVPHRNIVTITWIHVYIEYSEKCLECSTCPVRVHYEDDDDSGCCDDRDSHCLLWWKSFLCSGWSLGPLLLPKFQFWQIIFFLTMEAHFSKNVLQPKWAYLFYMNFLYCCYSLTTMEMHYDVLCRSWELWVPSSHHA